MTLRKIGIDFDNTVISYDEVFHRLALKAKLIDQKTPPNKQDVRDAIRRGKDGELAWQKLQADVYGPSIGEAKLFPGFKDFLIFCQTNHLETFIVSHKSQFAAQNDKDDLHVAADGFIAQNGLYDERYGLSREKVFFEPTRQKKIERIAQLGCDVFIDDLVETFQEAGFPKSVIKIYFNPFQAQHELPDAVSVSSWSAISKWLNKTL